MQLKNIDSKGKIFCMLMAIILYAGFAWAGEPILTNFISENPQYEPDKDNPDAFIYQNPAADLAAYQKVLIDPIEIWVAPDSKYKGLDADESKTITDALRQALVKELEPDYPVVNEPGPGVLGLRLAIINVHMKTKKRGLLGYTPVGLVVTTAGNLAGLRTQLSQATIQAELLDGETNEQLGALQDSFHSGKKGKKITWDEVGQRFEFYAKRFRARLDQAHSSRKQ